MIRLECLIQVEENSFWKEVWTHQYLWYCSMISNLHSQVCWIFVHFNKLAINSFCNMSSRLSLVMVMLLELFIFSRAVSVDARPELEICEAFMQLPVCPMGGNWCPFSFGCFYTGICQLKVIWKNHFRK